MLQSRQAKCSTQTTVTTDSSLIHAYLTQTAQVPKLLDGAKISPKFLTLWVGRNNVADDRH